MAATVNMDLPIGMVQQLKPAIEAVAATSSSFAEVAADLFHRSKHRPLDTTSATPTVSVELPKGMAQALAERPEVKKIANSGAFSPYTPVAQQLMDKASDFIRVELPLGMVKALKPAVEAVAVGHPDFKQAGLYLVAMTGYNGQGKPGGGEDVCDVQIPKPAARELARRPELIAMSRAGNSSPYTNLAQNLISRAQMA